MDELLAVGVSPLVGREAELTALEGALASARLVTVMGPGGVGKTRLALAALERSLSVSMLVELAPVEDPGMLAAAVLAGIGGRSEPGEEALESIVRSLAGADRLLLLDNCEHLRDAAASLCGRLLLDAPDLRILVTSRIALGVPGETTFEIEPLSLGATGDAVRLFVDRAGRASRAFSADAEVLERIGELCAELDGLPLAIELAAARTRMFDLERIASDLARRLDLLAGGQPDVPRHRSLRASIEWSCSLLSESERTLFERVSVFAGGWELEAAEEVCAGPIPAAEIMDLLGALIDHSLVFVDRSSGRPRFGMLSMVRAYAQERLHQTGTAPAVQAAHATWYAGMVERAERQLTSGDELAALASLDRERDNVRSAIAWARRVDPPLAIRIASSMALAWHTRGTFLEGRRELETLLRDRSEIPDQLRTRALWAFGAMLIAAGEFDRARPVVREAVASARGGDPAATARTLILLGELDLMTDPLSAQESLTEAVSLAREAGDTWCLADALGKLGAAALYRSDVTEAKPLLEECLQVAQRARDERSTHRALGGLARVAAINGQVDEALSLLDRSLELSQRLGDRSWIALDLAMQGEIQRLAGHPSDGETLAERGLALADEIGASYPRYMATGILGRTALARGDLAQAAARFERAIELAGQHGLRPFTPWWHLGLADVELARGDVDAAAARARDALASAEPLANRRDAGRATAVLGLVALARGEHDLAIAQLTAALSIQRELKDDIGARRSLENLASAFERSGRLERAERLRATLDRSAAGLDEAIALAMRGRTARRREPERGWAGLTGAEAEVAELAAAGASNPEIAKRLFMSRSTVKTHLSRVYAKLEVANRTELAAALAGQQGRPDS